ncbi:hypothetical protein BXO88_12535, partial [Oribacterium sp. C9]|uniref:hypothetical protein n=1 Tax=Oribacterium sp. C9 TaxID=1943579 RepID=UPI0009C5B7F4
KFNQLAMVGLPTINDERPKIKTPIIIDISRPKPNIRSASHLSNLPMAAEYSIGMPKENILPEKIAIKIKGETSVTAITESEPRNRPEIRVSDMSDKGVSSMLNVPLISME